MRRSEDRKGLGHHNQRASRTCRAKRLNEKPLFFCQACRSPPPGKRRQARDGESTGVKYFAQLSSVIRSKLGLKLDHKKQPGSLVLIDRVERTPIEN